MEQEQNQLNVPQEIIDKIIRFSDKNDTFTTKQLFETYPNNPEHLLRSGLVILRNQQKVYMYGNKRGAYYSKNKDIDTNAVVANSEHVKSSTVINLKDIIIEKAKKFNGNWFKRPDLVINDAPIPSVIESLKDLIAEGKIDVRGAKRWTEYRISCSDNNKVITEDDDHKDIPQSSNEAKENILNFIKEKRIVTIPMLIDKLEIQRYVIVKVLDELVEQEEIWHEGIKKSSKYIYKTVNASEIDEIVNQLQEDKSIVTSIDELSSFLHSDDNTVITIGNNTKQEPVITFIKYGEKIHEIKFKNMEELIESIYNLTEIKNG